MKKKHIKYCMHEMHPMLFEVSQEVTIVSIFKRISQVQIFYFPKQYYAYICFICIYNTHSKQCLQGDKQRSIAYRAACLDLFITFWPRQNGHKFPDDFFKCIFLNENI